MSRPVLGRATLGGNTEIVVTRQQDGRIDLRLWEDLNGTGIRIAGRHGITVPAADLPPSSRRCNRRRGRARSETKSGRPG
jgi:hypothetical protein